MTVITKRYVILFWALAAFAVGAISGGVLMNASLAPLKARLAHLQAVAEQYVPSQEELQQLEEQANNIKERVEGNTSVSKLQEIQATVAMLEKKLLPYPSLSTLQLKDYVGQTVGVYGTVIKARAKDGNLFVTSDGGVSIVVWGYTGEVPKPGQGVYAVGQVKLYNMKPEIIAENTTIEFVK